MRKYAILLSLTMMFCSFAGCLHEPSLVGSWYYGEEKFVEFNEDGTMINGFEGDLGIWSADGEYLTVNWGGNETEIMLFAIEQDWLWLTEERGGDCGVFAPEIMFDAEWEDAVSEKAKNLPSICGSVFDDF